MTKCKKCGYVLEDGQAFCNMCGAEQSKIREKQKADTKSLFGIVKFTSKNHRKAWVNLILGIGLLIYILSGLDVYQVGDSSYDIPALMMTILIMFYVIVQLFMGYKNPEATYTKRYKYGLRFTWAAYVFMVIYVGFINDNSIVITEWWKQLLGYQSY